MINVIYPNRHVFLILQRFVTFFKQTQSELTCTHGSTFTLNNLSPLYNDVYLLEVIFIDFMNINIVHWIKIRCYKFWECFIDSKKYVLSQACVYGRPCLILQKKSDILLQETKIINEDKF